MVIDIILDRYDGASYNPNYFIPYDFDYINKAIESKNELLVKLALCYYIDSQGYNKKIKKYIKSVNWLSDFNEKNPKNIKICDD